MIIERRDKIKICLEEKGREAMLLTNTEAWITIYTIAKYICLNTMTRSN